MNFKAAFQAIKKTYSTAALLHHVDYTKSFTLFCDASDHGVEDVLTQRQDTTQKKPAHIPIAFFSKRFISTPCHLSSDTKEAH